MPLVTETCPHATSCAEVKKDQWAKGPDDHIFITKVVIAEEPEVKLMLPRPVPPRQGALQPNYEVEHERFRSFRNSPLLNDRAQDLANSGLYLTSSNIVKCYSCLREMEVEEVDEDRSRWHSPSCPHRNQSPNLSLPRGEDFLRENTLLMESFSQLSLNTQEERGQKQNRMTSRYSDIAKAVLIMGYPEEKVKEVLDQLVDANEEADINDFLDAVMAQKAEDMDVDEYIEPSTATKRSGGIYQTRTGSNLFTQSGIGFRPDHPSHVGNLSAPRHPQRWRMANVMLADHRRFLSNLYLHRELDRLTSFARWPMSRPNVSPTALAKSGFFYLGDMDRTQCFSCGVVLRNWTSEDNAQEDHRTYFPSCPMVHGMERRNVPVPEEAETPEQRVRLYPCRYAANPHMRSEAARLDTFQHGWQTGRMIATPAEIARAGLFFLGERDRVKCWYCNGGLENWEYDDVPWVEHAKWFPNCQFLLQTKGQNYAHHHLSLNPHLVRPVIAKQEGATIGTTPSEVRGRNIPPSETRAPTWPALPPALKDRQEEVRKKQERIDQIVANSDIVWIVLAMGFSEDIVRAVIDERIDAGAEANLNDIDELLDAVMAKEEMNVEENNQPSMSTRSSVTAAKQVQQKKESQESSQEQLQKMKEERMCKICFSNDANVVFIPCGHFCCCLECTQAIHRCPMCRSGIERAIKVFHT